MKILVIHYSRTGTTKRVAEDIARNLQADIEQISTADNRMGFFGYLQCGFEATFRRLAKIDTTKNDPALFDLVVVGTPIWSFNVSSPARTFLRQNKGKIKRVAFFVPWAVRATSEPLTK